VRAQVANRTGLAADQVAISIPAKPDTAVDGRLRPGDTVQVLLTVIDKTRNEAHTRVVLDHAQILEVGRDQGVRQLNRLSRPETSSRGAIASVTLAVAADQARQLAEARRTGELDVVLLPPPEVLTRDARHTRLCRAPIAASHRPERLERVPAA